MFWTCRWVIRESRGAYIPFAQKQQLFSDALILMFQCPDHMPKGSAKTMLATGTWSQSVWQCNKVDRFTVWKMTSHPYWHTPSHDSENILFQNMRLLMFRVVCTWIVFAFLERPPQSLPKTSLDPSTKSQDSSTSQTSQEAQPLASGRTGEGGAPDDRKQKWNPLNQQLVPRNLPKTQTISDHIETHKQKHNKTLKSFKQKPTFCHLLSPFFFVSNLRGQGIGWTSEGGGGLGHRWGWALGVAASWPVVSGKVGWAAWRAKKRKKNNSMVYHGAW